MQTARKRGPGTSHEPAEHLELDLRTPLPVPSQYAVENRRRERGKNRDDQ
jgi:hypothetical protein